MFANKGSNGAKGQGREHNTRGKKFVASGKMPSGSAEHTPSFKLVLKENARLKKNNAILRENNMVLRSQLAALQGAINPPPVAAAPAATNDGDDEGNQVVSP